MTTAADAEVKIEQLDLSPEAIEKLYEKIEVDYKEMREKESESNENNNKGEEKMSEKKKEKEFDKETSEVILNMLKSMGVIDPEDPYFKDKAGKLNFAEKFIYAGTGKSAEGGRLTSTEYWTIFGAKVAAGAAAGYGIVKGVMWVWDSFMNNE